MVKGPDDDRRNSRRQIRTFSFRVRGIWPYVKKSTRITIRVDGRPLPIYRHGMYLSRDATAPSPWRRSGREWRGSCPRPVGQAALSKKLDTEWQQR